MSRRVGVWALARSAGLFAAEVTVPVGLYAVAVGLLALVGGAGTVAGLLRVFAALGGVLLTLALVAGVLALFVDGLGDVLRYGLGLGLGLLLARALVAGLTRLFGPVVERAVGLLVGAAETGLGLLLVLLALALALAVVVGGAALAVGPPYLALDALRDRYAAAPPLHPPVVWVAPPLVAAGAVGAGVVAAGVSRAAVVVLVAVAGSLALRTRLYVEATASDAAYVRSRVGPAATSAVVGGAAAVGLAGAVVPELAAAVPPADVAGPLVAGLAVAGAGVSLPLHHAYEWVVAPTAASGGAAETEWADDDGDTVLFRSSDE
jgi:hypothetical protein